MGHIIAVHSFRGGVGKSNIAANLAACLAAQDRRVAVLDLDIESPGLHVLFGLRGNDIQNSLNDYLLEGYPLDKVVYDVGKDLKLPRGRLLLLPSSMQLRQISRILKRGYSVALISSGIRHLIKALELDFLILDTHPGLNEETLFSFTIANLVLVVMRPDNQDYEGTSITLEATKRLEVPVSLIVNNIPPSLDVQEVKDAVEETYQSPVAAAIPHFTELMDLASSGLICLRNPEHPFSQEIARIATWLETQTVMSPVQVSA